MTHETLKTSCDWSIEFHTFCLFLFTAFSLSLIILWSLILTIEGFILTFLDYIYNFNCTRYIILYFLIFNFDFTLDRNVLRIREIY